MAAANTPQILDIDPLEEFLNLSSVLTGFSRVELQATGAGEAYLRFLTARIGQDLAFELWGLTRAIFAENPHLPAREKAVGERILATLAFGALARNIILLWYNATWYQLPPEWTSVYGAVAGDMGQVVSPETYPEALVWQAMHAHPPGAKEQGYGAWALPPSNLRSRNTGLNVIASGTPAPGGDA